MVSPIARREALRIWNSLRKRFKLDLTKITSKKDLIITIKKKLKVEDKTLKQIKGRKKSIIALVKKTDLWSHVKKTYKISVRRKDGIVYRRSKPRSWSPSELKILKSLKEKKERMGRKYSLSQLVEDFNTSNYRTRTPSSIINKYYRI